MEIRISETILLYIYNTSEDHQLQSYNARLIVNEQASINICRAGSKIPHVSHSCTYTAQCNLCCNKFLEDVCDYFVKEYGKEFELCVTEKH